MGSPPTRQSLGSMPTPGGPATRRQSGGANRTPHAGGFLTSPPPKAASTRKTRASSRSPAKAINESMSESPAGNTTGRLSIPHGVLSPSNRSNVQGDNDMTADTSLIGKLMDDIMPTRSGLSKSPKATKMAPASGAPVMQMENPSEILSRRLSHHRNSTGPSPRQGTPNSSGDVTTGQSTADVSLSSIGDAVFGGGADPSSRRLTADASQLDQFLNMLSSPGSRSSGVGISSRRRETADPDALRQLISELRSPGATQQTLDRVLKEFGWSSSDDNPDCSRVTVDSIMLERLTDDLDAVLGGDASAASPPAVPPRDRQQPSSGGRRLTADPCSLASLGLADDADTTMEESRQPAPAPPSSGKKSKTPPNKTKRRDTASPGVLAELLGDLDTTDGSNSTDAASSSRPEAADSNPMARAEKKNSSSQPMEGASAKKTSRLARTHSISPPSQQAPSATTGVEFSMSPPRPAPASSRRPLRSCLSSKRKARPDSDPSSPPPSASKKSVVFGSPDAAVFFKNSPSNSLTPMTKRDMQRHFPELHGIAVPVEQQVATEQQEEEGEEGVTAQNSAILAAWDRDGGSDDEADKSRESTSSSSKRKRVSRSPRPKRRQSLLLQSGSCYGIRDDDEDGEDAENAEKGPVPERLNDSMEPRDEDDNDAEPMDVSPIQSTPDTEDDMPDIGRRSPSFRSRDERTSAELGILGVAPLPPPALRLDDNEATVELENDLQSLMQQVEPQADAGAVIRKPAPQAHAQDFTEHGLGGAPEDRTVELEANLDSLLQSAQDLPAPAPLGRRVQQPIPTRQEETVQLEFDLGTLVNTADDDLGPAHDPERPSMMEMSVVDESDDGTVEYDEDEAHEMRLSLASAEDSPASSETGQLSIGVAPSRRSPITFNLSFGPTDSPGGSTPSAGGIARFRLPSRDSSGSRTSRSSAADESAAPERTEDDHHMAVSSSQDSLARSPSTSLGGQHLTEDSTDSSLFAHIRTGRSRSETLAISSTSSSSMQPKASKKKGRSSTTNTLPEGSTESTDDEDHTGTSQSLAPATSSSEDGHCSKTTSSITFSLGPDMVDHITTDDEHAAREGRESSTGEGASSPVALDWAEACTFQATRSKSRLQHLLVGKRMAKAPVKVQQVVREALEAGVNQVIGTIGGDQSVGLEEVKQAVTGQVEGSEHQVQQHVQEAIPRVTRILGKRWRSMETQVIEMAKAKLSEEVSSVKQRADVLQAKLHELEAIKAREKEATATMKRNVMRGRAEAVRATVMVQQKRMEASQTEMKELEAKRSAAQRRIAAARAMASDQAIKKALEEKLEGRDRLARKLAVLEEKGNMMRHLYLAQPLHLQTDGLGFRYSHPNGSQTELHLTISNRMVTSVVITNKTISSKRRSGSRARSLLHHVLQWPLFPGVETAPPTKAGEGSWTWSVQVPCSKIKPALRRFETIIGRTNLLLLMVARTEEAFSCTLTLGGQVLQREESWLEDCLYGSSTTCAFEHDHGCSPVGAGSRLVRRSQPSGLLPHCIGMLTVHLQPKRRGSSTPGASRVTLKLILSLSFLTQVPAKLEPSLPELGSSSKGDIMAKLAPFLNRRFGDSRAPALGPLEGGPAAALVLACKQVEAFLA